ncbi:MAG: MCE family protein, partial [Deltaproteobacteria bacterium]|nr:MCE family protein [Deltaproteobacteria bacterium]
MEARTKKEVLVGMLALVAASCLVIIYVSETVLKSEKTYTLHVDFDQQGSLSAGGQVMVTGIVAGRIERISFRCDNSAASVGKCVRFTL